MATETSHQHPAPRLWYSYGADMPLVQVGPRGFLFGRGTRADGVDIDLSQLSRRVFGSHCRIWLVRGEYILYNTCLKKNATFIARAVQDAPAKAGDVRITLPGGTEAVVLTLAEVGVDARLDLSRDCVLLVAPTAPDGQVLLRFLPDGEGGYNLNVQPINVEVIQ